MTEYRSLDSFREQIEKEPGKMVFESTTGWLVRPFFRAKSGNWSCLEVQNEAHCMVTGGDPGWTPHVPAPPKVKRWKFNAVFSQKDGRVPIDTQGYYKDPQDCRQNDPYATHALELHRLDETEREFEW